MEFDKEKGQPQVNGFLCCSVRMKQSTTGVKVYYYKKWTSWNTSQFNCDSIKEMFP